MTSTETGAAPELLYWWSLASVIGWEKWGKRLKDLSWVDFA